MSIAVVNKSIIKTGFMKLFIEIPFEKTILNSMIRKASKGHRFDGHNDRSACNSIVEWRSTKHFLNPDLEAVNRFKISLIFYLSKLVLIHLVIWFLVVVVVVKILPSNINHYLNHVSSCCQMRKLFWRF